MGIFTLALCALALLPFALTIPTPSSVNSDITLLYYNDLDGISCFNLCQEITPDICFQAYTASEHKSVLLLTPRAQQDAATACAGLSETLLPVNQTFFSTELVPLLQYQAYEGAYGSSQFYWIESVGDSCTAVDSLGIVTTVSCDTELPALCSQSSAYGTYAEPSNMLTVLSNDLTITGCVRPYFLAWQPHAENSYSYRDQLSFKFEGIPYVDPPTRFTYSTPYTGSKTLNATAYGPECIQAGVPTGSEDCLYLNIWTPYIPLDPSTVSASSLKPVLFWIHGGAFTSGTGSDPTFAGGNMASRGDVVVVTINYRLSTLGFLALEDGVTNGNFGVADQVAALDWVREYITAFGGDVNRITIFGQSAGAGSVRALLGSSEAIGKYAAAVPMSNLAGSDYATTYSLYYTIPEEVEVAVYPILEEIGCNITDALACLRAYDAYGLVSLTNVARLVFFPAPT